MRYLKTNTATRITVGPFLDKTDGITPEVALTVTSCKLTLMVDTGGVPTLVLDTAPTASGGANDMVHVTNDDAGFYDLELAAANVNYVGNAMLAITDVATHCPVFHEFVILPAVVYDSLIGGTDTLQADMIQILGTAVATPATAGLLDVNVKEISTDATAADNAELMFDGTGYAGGTARLKVDVDTIKTQAVTCAAGVTVLASVGTAATSTAQTGDCFPLVSTEVAEIYAAVITNAAGVDIAADIIAVKADTAAILADTGTDGVVVAAASKTGYDLVDAPNATAITAIQTSIKGITIADGDTLAANSWLLWLRRLKWILASKLSVVDASGAATLTKDDGVTSAGTLSITDDSTTTVRTVITWA